MRVLAMNDDTHDTVFCFETGHKMLTDDFIDYIAVPHKENYEIKRLFLPDVVDELIHKYPGDSEEGLEMMAVMMFDDIIFNHGIPKINYLERFEELWEL